MAVTRHGRDATRPAGRCLEHYAQDAKRLGLPPEKLQQILKVASTVMRAGTEGEGANAERGAVAEMQRQSMSDLNYAGGLLHSVPLRCLRCL